MKIAISTIYRSYDMDRLFCADACTIGENLLLPNIILKNKLNSLGHELHTVDMYGITDVDKLVFQEIPKDSLLTIKTPMDLARYIVKKKWKTDYFLKSVLVHSKDQRILIILEPPVFSPQSYNPKFHRYFSKILTWDDTLAEKPPYQKVFCPQYVPKEQYTVSFEEKKQFVMIAGNKKSNHVKELYSARQQVIEFFENKQSEFDLFGFGWETENFNNYRGTVDRKLQTLSRYKYSVCFENMKDAPGYITEKIFDCFFAGCVPIYWGANNITDYIPEGTFIDMRRFDSIEEMYQFVNRINQNEYEKYLERIQQYLKSEEFQKSFSVERYIDTFIHSVV